MIRNGLFTGPDYPKDIKCFVCGKTIKVGDQFRHFGNSSLSRLDDNSEFYLEGAEPTIGITSLKVSHKVYEEWYIEICEDCFQRDRDKTYDQEIVEHANNMICKCEVPEDYTGFCNKCHKIIRKT